MRREVWRRETRREVVRKRVLVMVDRSMKYSTEEAEVVVQT